MGSNDQFTSTHGARDQVAAGLRSEWLPSDMCKQQLWTPSLQCSSWHAAPADVMVGEARWPAVAVPDSDSAWQPQDTEDADVLVEAVAQQLGPAACGLAGQWRLYSSSRLICTVCDPRATMLYLVSSSACIQLRQWNPALRTGPAGQQTNSSSCLGLGNVRVGNVRVGRGLGGGLWSWEGGGDSCHGRVGGLLCPSKHGVALLACAAT
jgi:hypothetical protein